jgi:hypothetical protein
MVQQYLQQLPQSLTRQRHKTPAQCVKASASQALTVHPSAVPASVVPLVPI